ncbi:hypothetical protein [Labrys sp. 22185]|uniref:hypothetical protein n=1 Tax=Labrys sp. 22185 TaxID=3453888 RepID=UPI003F85DB8D
MSRYNVTLRHGERLDFDAVLGFDPPLRTFFLQGFLYESDDCEDFEIWLGITLDEFPTLEALVETARARGYVVEGLAASAIVEMMAESGLETSKSVGERGGLVISGFNRSEGSR